MKHKDIREGDDLILIKDITLTSIKAVGGMAPTGETLVKGTVVKVVQILPEPFVKVAVPGRTDLLGVSDCVLEPLVH